MSPPSGITNEKLFAKLLKNSYLIKRNEFRKNAVPLRARDNLKSAVKQHKNELIGIETDLNVMLDKTKLLEDEQLRNEIYLLLKKEEQGISMLNDMEKILEVLESETVATENSDFQGKKKLKGRESKRLLNQRKLASVKKYVLVKTKMYDREVEELKDLWRQFDAIIKEMAIKHEEYNKMMTRLEQNTALLGKMCHKSLAVAKKIEHIDKIMEKDRVRFKKDKAEFEDTLILTNQKFREDLNMNEFMRAKCLNRINKHYADSETNTLEPNRENMLNLIHQLVRVCGTTDLEDIVKTIESIDYDKEILFRNVVMLEKDITKKQRAIDNKVQFSIDQKVSRARRKKFYAKRLTSLVKQIKEVDKCLPPIEEELQYLMGEYGVVTKSIMDLFGLFHIDNEALRRCEIDEPMNQYNAHKYFRAMEEEGNEMLIRLNCAQECCLTGPNDDPLSSDFDSTHNLLNKSDIHGVEIKAHRFYEMDGHAETTSSADELDPSYLPHNPFSKS